MNVSGAIPMHIARAYGVQPSRPATPPANAERLVAGRVEKPVDVDLDSPPSIEAGTLPLYTRAADKVEVSVAVQLGRTVDLTG
jgi:hypothetical protein